MACGLLEESGSMEHRTALGVIRGKDQSLNAGKRHSGGAHGAGLQRYEKLRAHKPFVAELRCGLPHHQDFGMGRGVLELHDAVARSGQNLAAHDEDGPHGHLLTSCRGLGLLKGQRHVFLIRHARDLAGAAHFGQERRP